MKIKINSLEYQCWQEAGHAAVCFYLGGDINSIEFVDDPEAKGIARARCKMTPEIRNFVVCGGFATEYLLFKKNRLFPIDEKEFTQIAFKNAIVDREMFFNHPLSKNDEFTIEEDTKFKNCAIDEVVPIIRRYLPKMREIVKELVKAKKIDGTRIKQILK